MTSLPKTLFRAEQVRAMDRFAIDQLKIPGYDLMQNAGQAAFNLLNTTWPDIRRIAVICGGGNNAGDGYIVARLALETGFDVSVIALSPVSRLKGDALSAYQAFKATGGKTVSYNTDIYSIVDFIVDAMLGTGLDREVSGKYADVIRDINNFGGPVLALDIPSGLHADTGSPLGNAVRADLTITFIGLKQGLFTGAGVEYSGRVIFDSLKVPETVQQSEMHSAELLLSEGNVLLPRGKNSHKGNFGHVLVVGGDTGYTGAARMAAEAAARVGAGLVSIATRKTHADMISLTRPEIMSHGLETKTELRNLLQRVTAVAIGPGLGQSSWAVDFFHTVFESKLAMIVDADALNLLALNPCRRNNWVLTPHPGEAARLLKTSVAEIQNDRFGAVKSLVDQYGGVIALKGAGTIVCNGSNFAVNTSGNAGMASGGMGDVLTGVLAGLIAQKLSLWAAAKAGVYIHSKAADLAANDGERGLLASDLMIHFRHLVNR